MTALVASDRREASALLTALGRPILGRPELSGGAPAEFAQLRALASRADWPTVARWAGRLHLSPWVLHHSRALDLPIPADARARLATDTTRLTRRTLANDLLLDQLAPLVSGDAPPALVLKGPAIEQRAYPAGVVRPMLDIDLVTRPGAEAEVMRALRARGFRQVWCSRSGHDIGMRSAAGAVVEVHTSPLCPFRFAPFARSGETAQLFVRAGRDAKGRWILGDNDLSAYLLVHLVEAVYTDQRHVADAAAWLRAVRPDAAGIHATLVRWEAIRAGISGLEAVAAFDEGAISPSLNALLLAVKPDLQGLAARLSRLLATRIQERTGGHHPRWMEGVGLALHLDRPGRFAWTYAR